MNGKSGKDGEAQSVPGQPTIAPSMTSRSLIIQNPHGVHARPAVRFVQVAIAHGAAVRVRKGDKCANGKSVLALLTLGVKCHDVVTLEVDGNDEEMTDRLGDILSQGSEDDNLRSATQAVSRPRSAQS
jgi:phosphocarrier protein HPr